MQQSFDANPRQDCVTGSLEVAQQGVHIRYRTIVPEGQDTEFTFILVTKKGVQGIPEKNLDPDDIVLEFEGLEGGQRGWVKTFDRGVIKDIRLIKPAEGIH